MMVIVTPFDVLSGRNKAAFGHEGNNYFRDLVQQFREPYQTAAKRHDKNAVATTLIRLVEQRGGRFLKMSEGYEEYEVMSPEDAYEKVTHALRGAKSPTSSPKKVKATKKQEMAAAPPLPPPLPVSAVSFHDIMMNQRIIFDKLVRQHELGARRAGSQDDYDDDVAPIVVSDSGSSDEDDDEVPRAENQDSWPILPSSMHEGLPTDLLYPISEDIHPSEFELLSPVSLSFYGDEMI
jgi:hypothetical protein